MHSFAANKSQDVCIFFHNHLQSTQISVNMDIIKIKPRFREKRLKPAEGNYLNYHLVIIELGNAAERR